MNKTHNIEKELSDLQTISNPMELSKKILEFMGFENCEPFDVVCEEDENGHIVAVTVKGEIFGSFNNFSPELIKWISDPDGCGSVPTEDVIADIPQVIEDYIKGAKHEEIR